MSQLFAVLGCDSRVEMRSAGTGVRYMRGEFAAWYGDEGGRWWDEAAGTAEEVELVKIVGFGNGFVLQNWRGRASSDAPQIRRFQLRQYHVPVRSLGVASLHTVEQCVRRLLDVAALHLDSHPEAVHQFSCVELGRAVLQSRWPHQAYFSDGCVCPVQDVLQAFGCENVVAWRSMDRGAAVKLVECAQGRGYQQVSQLDDTKYTVQLKSPDGEYEAEVLPSGELANVVQRLSSDEGATDHSSASVHVATVGGVDVRIAGPAVEREHSQGAGAQRVVGVELPPGVQRWWSRKVCVMRDGVIGIRRPVIRRAEKDSEVQLVGVASKGAQGSAVWSGRGVRLQVRYERRESTRGRAACRAVVSATPTDTPAGSVQDVLQSLHIFWTEVFSLVLGSQSTQEDPTDEGTVVQDVLEATVESASRARDGGRGGIMDFVQSAMAAGS